MDVFPRCTIPFRLGRRQSLSAVPDGFTLIELLVAVSIMAMIALAVFSALAGGLNVYRRLSSSVIGRTDVLLALEKMERDLRNAFPLSSIGFQGDASRMRVAGLVAQEDTDGGRTMFPGCITYCYDPLTRTINREAVDYAHAISGERAQEGGTEILASVESVRFSYFLVNVAAQTYEWKTSWNGEDGMPLGVRIELDYRKGRQLVCMERTVFLPGAW